MSQVTTTSRTNRALLKDAKTMSAVEILLTFASIVVAASLLIAVLFRFWSRYGSVEAAVASTDQVLDQMEQATSEP